MLIPNKFTNPDYSLLRVSSLVLSKLIKKQVLKFWEILAFLNWELEIDCTDLLIQSMGFLYLIGKIEYRIESDSILLIPN